MPNCSAESDEVARHAPKPCRSHVYFEACLHDDRCCTSSSQEAAHACVSMPAMLLLAPNKEGCEMIRGCSSMAERAAYNRLTQVRFLTPLPTCVRSLVDEAAEFYSARRGFESYRTRHQWVGCLHGISSLAFVREPWPCRRLARRIPMPEQIRSIGRDRGVVHIFVSLTHACAAPRFTQG